MKRTVLIISIAILSVALGYYAMSAFPYTTPSSVPQEETVNLEKETVHMVRFMNPAITEEVAKKYLAELKKLNVRYGYTHGGSPKGDMGTMQAYAQEVAVLQETFSILPKNSEQGVGSVGKPALAPAQVDVRYVPPAGPSDAGVSTSSPALQRGNTSIVTGPAAANPTGIAAQGGAASSPPLIEQDIPPAPPLPPQMSSE